MKPFLKNILVVASTVLLFACGKDDDPAPVTPDPNIVFKATLSGGSEVPANTSTASGQSTLTFNNNTKVFTITTTYTGMTATAAHIHRGAPGEAPPSNVVFGFPDVGSPINYTSAPLTAAQEADLKANLYYVNVHSAAFPGGEIRGQLIRQ